MNANSEFRRLKQLLFQEMTASGWTSHGTRCIRTLDDVQHTVTARVDKTGIIALGLWVKVLGIPHELKNQTLLYGHISSTLWPSSWTSNLYISDFRFEEVLGVDENWKNWSTRIVIGGINPFFSQFQTTVQCCSLTDKMQKELGLAISLPFRKYIGLYEPSLWEFEPFESLEPP